MRPKNVIELATLAGNRTHLDISLACRLTLDIVRLLGVVEVKVEGKWELHVEYSEDGKTKRASLPNVFASYVELMYG